MEDNLPYIKFDSELRHITDISVGIYADPQGFSISVVGIEEKELRSKPFDKYRKFAYRYWLLDLFYNTKISHRQINNIINRMLKEYEDINNINTNEKTLTSILNDVSKVNLMDLSEDNLMTLIKSLSNDGKLKIKKSLKELVIPFLTNYNPEEINYIAIALYLGLSFKIDKIVNSYSME